MYYDNKSTFYIKQYGPAVFTIVISLVLVLGGLYIYLSSNKNNRPQDTLVAKNDFQTEQNLSNEVTEEQTNSLEKVPEEIVNNNIPEEKAETEVIKPEEQKMDINNLKISNVLSAELRMLGKLEKSKELTVLGIDDENNIILNISDNNYKASLIGIDYKKSNSNIKEKLNNDLVNKQVTVAFDNVKFSDNKLCVYLYIDGNLYNESLLKDGLAILKVEKANTSLLNELVNAQKQAKTNNIGIWKR